ncbi:MAG TPA: nuclear transport factor 2 family protein, partial [Candidatus Limnocylindria bacterium]|nr:nuclear transport factor 2 family protein [Candidatus Limnocylindria bacterium]
MVQSDNRALVERFYEEVINGRRLEVADELLTPDFVEHGTMAPPPGRDGLKSFLSDLAASASGCAPRMHEARTDPE